jgi:tetratricopeptide (TPR) repeat protein
MLLSLEGIRMHRKFNPAFVLLFVAALFVVASFDAVVGRPRLGDAAGVTPSSVNQQLTLDRLNPGHFALREATRHAMVLDAFSREEYEEPRITEAWRALAQANVYWRGTDRQAASAGWRELVQKYPGTEAAFEAQVNFAQAARLCGDRNAAIRAYRELIDFLPPANGQAIYHCSNERHWACAELSDMYLESGDLSRALTFAELALDTYPLADFCGVYLMSYNQGLQDRIRAIKRAIAEGNSLGIKPRTAD